MQLAWDHTIVDLMLRQLTSTWALMSWIHYMMVVKHIIHDLVQDCGNSTADALELS